MLALPMGVMAQEKQKKNTKISFEVNGNCEMCKKRIEKAAFSVKGVKMAMNRINRCDAAHIHLYDTEDYP